MVEQTHCKHGHEFTPENTRIVKGRFRHCRTCQRFFARKRKHSGKLSRGQIERLLQALRDGKSLQHVTGFKGNNGRKQYVPGQAIARGVEIKAFMRNNPLIGRRMQKLIDANGKAAMMRANEARRIVAAPALIRNDGADAYQAIMSATRDLALEIRNDVQGDMFIAIAEGRLRIADIPSRVQEFRLARNRADRNSVFNPWGHISLDKPLNDDSDSTFLDVIREDQRLWG